MLVTETQISRLSQLVCRPSPCEQFTISDQNCSAIDYHGLACAVSLLHEEKIRSRNLASFADAAHEQTLPSALIQLIPVFYTHILPEVRSNDARRYRVDANRR